MEEFLKYNNFIKNKYLNVYIKIIQKVLFENRVYDSSEHEYHHILPKSFGGVNMAILTFKEHYICHILLTKFTCGTDKMKMCFALHTFFHFNKNRTMDIKRGRLYEAHKKMFIEECKNRIPHTAKDIFTFKNRKTNEQFIGTRNDFKKYSGLTPQEIYNIIYPNNLIRHSKNWGVFLPGKNIFSYEIPLKRAPVVKNKLCKYCNKMFDSTNYKRWHGEKCKSISVNVCFSP